jgi:hypothetical protein
MSLWALWMFVVSTITTGLTLWALWFVRGTFKVTVKMAGKTEQATEAMVKANDIALQAQRPWLQVEARLREIDLKEEWNSLYFEAIVTNIGKMVAERCAVRIAIINDDTSPSGQRAIKKARMDAESAALGELPEGRSPYPMLPQQSETTGLKRDAMGLPWQKLRGGSEVLRITFFVTVRYFLPGDDIMRKTERAFCLTYIPQGSARDDLILPFGIMRPLPADLSIETVWLRPAGHNVTT